MKTAHESKIKSFFSLFSENELKGMFKKYIIFMIIVEIIIFIGCWLYQAGSPLYDRFGPVSVPFPWKIYFLTAFIVPIAITFVMGVFITTFENFFLAKKKHMQQLSGENVSNFSFSRLSGPLFSLPFLLSLLGVGVFFIILYDLDNILFALSEVGADFFEVSKIFVYGIVGCGGVGAFVWLFLNYKIRKKEMDYLYRLEIADKTGVAWIEKDKVVDKDGRLYFNLEFGENDSNDESNIIYLPGIKKKGYK